MAKETISKSKVTKTYTNAADNITITGSSNTISTMGGNDTVKLTKGSKNTVKAGVGIDTLTVDKSAGTGNKIYGEAGADKISINGGSSNYIYGGNDKDTITIAATMKGTKNSIYGDAGVDTIKVLGGSSNNIYGGADGDKITVSGGSKNKIYGDDAKGKVTGKDSFTVSGGNSNYIYGGNGVDTINVTANAATGNYIYGEAGDDKITVKGGSKNRIYGDDAAGKVTGKDTFTVSGGSSNYIYGGNGVDTINVTANAATGNYIYGEAGDDKITVKGGSKNRIYADDAKGKVTGKDNITVSGGTGNYIYGGNGVDTININAGTGTGNYIYGDAGKDSITISGGSSNTIYGGADADTIKLSGESTNNNIIYGDAGADKITVSGGSSTTVYGGDDGDSVTISGGSGNKIYGDDGNDTIKLTGGTNNTVDGGADDDKIYAGSGTDSLTGGEGNDTFYFTTASTGTVTVEDYEEDADTIRFTNGVEVESSDVSGHDIVLNLSTSGKVTLKDTVGKVISVYDDATGESESFVFGTDEDDVLFGTDGKDSLEGRGGDDILYAGDGDDYLVGGTGTNMLYGEAGDDELKTLGGGDILSGGSGSDTYVLTEAMDENTHITIDQSDFEDGDADILRLKATSNDEVEYSLEDGTLTITHSSGGTITVEGWEENPLAEIRFAGGESVTTEDINDILASAGITEINWALGGSEAFDAAELGTGLQINGYKANDFIATLSGDGMLVLTDAAEGTISISNWNEDENTLETIGFTAEDYEESFTKDEFGERIFNRVILADNANYTGGEDEQQEFVVNLNPDTNVIIRSESGIADRIKISDNHSADDFGFEIKGNDLYINDYNNKAKTGGKIVIENYRENSVRTVEFADVTYHLVLGSDAISGASDTYEDRYVLLDNDWRSGEVAEEPWEVTVENGNATLDFRFLPNNSRYYSILDEKDGQDLVLTYRYSPTSSTGATLGTIRLQNFYNEDGTVNTANGYPKIRTNREVYAGYSNPEEWDNWVWNKGEKFRFLKVNAGSAEVDEVDLREERPGVAGKRAWMYFAGAGDDIVTAGEGDIVYGDSGNDTIHVTSSFADVHGGADNDVILIQGEDGNQPENVVARADSGNDTITAYGTYHYINGGDGDDIIELRSDENGNEASNNGVSASRGDDHVYIYGGNDNIINGHDGTDYLYVEGNRNVLQGGRDNDTLHLESGEENVLQGGGGDDILEIAGGTWNTLYGGAGNDTFTVDGGNDNVLMGRTGSDTYIFNTEFTEETRLTISQWDFEEGDEDKLQLVSVNKDEVEYSLEDGTLIITHSSGGTITVEGWEENPLAEIKFAGDESVTVDDINELIWKDYNRVEVNSSGEYQGTEDKDYFTFNGFGWEATISALNGDDTLDVSNYEDYSVAWQDNAIKINFSDWDGEVLSSVTLNDSNINVNLKTEYDTKHLIAGTEDTVNGTDGNDLIVVTHDGQTVYTNGGSDHVIVGGRSYSYWTEDGETYVEVPAFSGTNIHFSEDGDGGAVTIYGGSGHIVNGNGTDLDVSINSSESNVINGSGSVRIYDGSGNTVNSDGGSLDVYARWSEDTTVNGSNGNDIISFEGYGGTGNKVYGNDGNDTLTANYSSNGVYLNGGAGNDTYKVFFEGDDYYEEDSQQKIITVDNSTADAADRDKLLICGWDSFTDSLFRIEDGNLEISRDNETVIIQGWSDRPLAEIGVVWDEEEEATWLTTEQVESRIDYSTNYITMKESGSYVATDSKDCFMMAANNLDVSISDFTGEDIISVPANETVAVSGVDNGDLTLALTDSNSTITVKDYFNGNGQIQLKSGRETKNLVADTSETVNGTTGDDLIMVIRDGQTVYTKGGNDRVIVGGRSYWTEDGEETYVELPVFSGTNIYFSENSDGGSVTIYGGSGHTVNGNGTGLDVRINSSDANTITGSGSIRINCGESNVINGSGRVWIYDGSGNTINSDGNPLDVYARWSEDTTVNGSSGDDIISFEGSGGTGNKVYGNDGNDTLTANYSSNGMYLNGGAGNDTYKVIVEGDDYDYDEGYSSQKIITVDNRNAAITDRDKLLICGWNSYNDCDFYLEDGNLEISRGKKSVVIQGWADHPLTEIGFAWDEEDEATWLTAGEVGDLITLNQVIEISESGAYKGTEGKDTFVFSESGWEATITGATGKDRLDFSQYTDGTYGITSYSQSGDDLVMHFSKYGDNPGDGTTLVGTLTMEDFFTAENRLSQLSFYDAAAQATRDFNLTIGKDGGYGNDIILAGNDDGSWLSGFDGDDVLIGGAGDDDLSGDTGNDVLIGGDGNDVLSGSEGNDILYGGDDDDELYGGHDDDVLVGGDGTDYLQGGEGNDRLYATAGKDILFGGDGDDIITVNGGNGHELRGGSGSDIYVINTAFEYDTGLVLDQWEYEDGDTDILQLATVNKDDVVYAEDNGTLTITHTSGGTVTVEGWGDNPLAEVQFADGTITGAEINESLAEPEVVTQQSVIKKFMNSLDNNTTLAKTRDDAIAALDVAVNYASNGKFATWDALTESFISDVGNYGVKDDSTASDFTYDGVDAYGHATNIVPESGLDRFLKNYCGIDLTNEDTGSIIGADAGGAEVKTAVSIVPEDGTVAALSSPEPGTTTTINGLTFHWPETVENSQQQYIIDSLYTWWAEEGLNLVNEAFSLSFEEENVTGKDMTVEFVEEDENFLAKVKSNYQYEYTESGTEKVFTSENTTLTMQINMKYYNSVDTTGVDGYAAEYNSYLDRTIAHEFTHAIMAATMERVYGGGALPLYVTEGLAELVHGIDDTRTTDIIGLARSTNTEYLTTVLKPNVNAGSSSYAAGYMLFRYLAKQVAGTVNGQAANESPNVIATPSSDVVGELASASSMLLSENGVVSSDSGESSLAIASIRNSLIDFADSRISDSLSGTQEEDKQNNSLFITGNV